MSFLFTVTCSQQRLKVPCAPKWFGSRVSNDQNDETISRNLLRYLSEANFPMRGSLVAAGHLSRRPPATE